MNDPFEEDDDYEDFPAEDNTPGSKRTQDAPWSLMIQDVMATAMWRIMNDANDQGLFMEMMSTWDTNKIKRYQDSVVSVYAYLGFPEIDYELINQEIN